MMQCMYGILKRSLWSQCFCDFFIAEFLALGDFHCPKSFGNFPYVQKCGRFYTCLGNLAIVRACPPRHYFDTNLNRCTFKENVTCSSNGSSTDDGKSCAYLA